MITFHDVGDVCKEKWNNPPEAAISMEGCPFNMYFRVRMPKVVNDCDPYKNGEYLLFKALKPYLKTVVDVGARDDTYYIENAEQTTALFLFEPHPVFFGTLCKALEDKELHRYNPNVTLLNMGVSDSTENLHYYERAQSFVNRWNEVPSQTLPVVRLDSLQALKEAHEISFIKVDTEGYELDVLHGAEGILGKTKLIQFEYGGTYPHRGIHLKDVLTYLQANQFHFFYYIYGDGLLPLDSMTVLEHEQYTNILASKFCF
jgi:FkbM family methyltransferase